MEEDTHHVDVSLRPGQMLLNLNHPRRDMRVLNSGRRWGSEVPTNLDLSRDIDILGAQVGDRTIVQTRICRRLAALEALLKKVPLQRASCVKH